MARIFNLLDRLAMRWIAKRRLPPQIGTPGLAVSACIVEQHPDYFAVFPIGVPVDRVHITAINYSQIIKPS